MTTRRRGKKVVGGVEENREPEKEEPVKEYKVGTMLMTCWWDADHADHVDDIDDENDDYDNQACQGVQSMLIMLMTKTIEHEVEAAEAAGNPIQYPSFHLL